jgi:hypothetical protein
VPLKEKRTRQKFKNTHRHLKSPLSKDSSHRPQAQNTPLRTPRINISLPKSQWWRREK